MQEVTNKIYISNMKPGSDENSLRKIFIKYGDIININHRGSYAFVEFIEIEAVMYAIKDMADKSEMRVQKAYAKQPQN